MFALVWSIGVFGALAFAGIHLKDCAGKIWESIFFLTVLGFCGFRR